MDTADNITIGQRLRRIRMFDIAQEELDAVALPATVPETADVVGSLMMTNASVAMAGSRPGDVAAPMEAAAELAQRFGELGKIDPLRFLFGPTDVGLWRMALALEAGEPDRAVSIAGSVSPMQHAAVSRQATYWVDYGGRQLICGIAVTTPCARSSQPRISSRCGYTANPFARDRRAGRAVPPGRGRTGPARAGVASRAERVAPTDDGSRTPSRGPS